MVQQAHRAHQLWGGQNGCHRAGRGASWAERGRVACSESGAAPGPVHCLHASVCLWSNSEEIGEFYCLDGKMTKAARICLALVGARPLTSCEARRAVTE